MNPLIKALVELGGSAKIRETTMMPEHPPSNTTSADGHQDWTGVSFIMMGGDPGSHGHLDPRGCFVVPSTQTKAVLSGL